MADNNENKVLNVPHLRFPEFSGEWKKHSINKYPVCTKQGILGIVPNTNIDVEFLYYFMQSSYFQKEVERVVTEGTMKTAYLKDINHIKCPIPDLDRQKEISHLLSVLSLKEDVERQLLQKYQIQKQYLLRKMFI